MDYDAKRNGLRAKRICMSFPSSLMMAWNGVKKPEAFSGRQIGGHDDVLDFFVGHLINVEMTRNQRRNRPLAFSTPPFCQEA